MTSTTIFRLRFNRNYTTFIKTSRGIVKVDFTPIVLFGRTENSQFGTADAEVIEGLKKHRDFGSLFFIEEEGKTVPDKEKVGARGTGDTDVATETKTDKKEASSSETRAEDNLTHENTVTSKNKAIAYLLEKHGATFSQTSDIAAMKEEARNVYNIVFDNWE